MIKRASLLLTDGQTGVGVRTLMSSDPLLNLQLNYYVVTERFYFSFFSHYGTSVPGTDRPTAHIELCVCVCAQLNRFEQLSHPVTALLMPAPK